MERLGDDPRRILAAAGSSDTGEVVAVSRVWRDAVGPAVAAAAWPSRIARDGTMHVATVSSVWAFELGRMQDQVLEQVRALLPDLRATSVRFAPGPVPEPAAEPRPGPGDPPVPTAEETAAGRSLAASIADDGLRETVARAAAASLARARSDRRFW